MARVLIVGLDARGADVAGDACASSASSSTPTIRVCASPPAPARPLARSGARRCATTRRAGAAAAKGDGIVLHVSGCAKGCAHAGRAARRLSRPRRATISSRRQAPAIRPRGAVFRARRSTSSLVCEARHVRGERPPREPSYDYEKDGAEIYRRSFAIIRARGRSRALLADEERVAVRVIHACGMVEAARRSRLLARRGGGGARRAARAARRSSAMRGWSPKASRARGCRRTTTSSARSPIPRRPDSPRSSARRAPRRRSSSGCRGSAARSSRSAMRRPRCFACSNCSPPARRAGRDHRHAGRLRRRGGIEGGADRERPARHRRARAQGRQRDGRGGRQRAGERRGMSAIGRLYGVGLGPGDPELLTVKAVRLIAAAPVVAFFAKAGRRGNAREIVDRWLKPRTSELPLYYPVTTEIAFRRSALSRGAGALLRGKRRGDRRASRSRARRRAAERGRSAVLRLVHASVRPACASASRSRSCPASPASPAAGARRQRR